MKDNENIIRPADVAFPSADQEKVLNKQFLNSFFIKLRWTSHHIYVLLDNLPAETFAVLHYKTMCEGDYYMENPRFYTLREFNASAYRFGEYDEFRVMFDKTFFYFESEMTQQVIERCYANYLKEKCQTALRNNTPFSLTPYLIYKYELREKDIEIIDSYLDKYNNEALKKLDCVR